jgi:RNA polymerase sigma-70 factor (ECF subfamily)
MMMDALSQNSPGSDRLLATAQSGDPAAFWQLAESYRPYLKAVTARLLGNRLASKADVSDVVQQGLMVAFERLADFRGEDASQWQSWVLAIVRNQAKKLLRHWYRQRRDVRREQPLAAGSSDEHQLAADSSGPSQRAIQREQTARLLAAIERLRPDYREVIQLRNFEDLPFAEVAARMKRTEGAVRVLWTRAVERLRDEWGDES